MERTTTHDPKRFIRHRVAVTCYIAMLVAWFFMGGAGCGTLPPPTVEELECWAGKEPVLFDCLDGSILDCTRIDIAPACAATLSGDHYEADIGFDADELVASLTAIDDRTVLQYTTGHFMQHAGELYEIAYTHDAAHLDYMKVHLTCAGQVISWYHGYELPWRWVGSSDGHCFVELSTYCMAEPGVTHTCDTRMHVLEWE